MATLRTYVCMAFVVVFIVFNIANAETTPSTNGTKASTSDSGKDDGGLVLDKSMNVLYDMVKKFLNVVQPKTIEDLKWLNFTALVQLTQGKQIGLAEYTRWQNYTDYLVGFAVCIAFGLIFVIVMPIVGCCVCCCRCCGRCGGGKQIHDPKRAKCKRGSYCTVLLLLTTIMLAGAVCAFVSNDLIHKYLRNENNQGPVGKLNSAFSGLTGYVHNTADEAERTVLTKFDSYRDEVVSQINQTASNAVQKVADQVNATELLASAETLSTKVNQTQQTLVEASQLLKYLADDGKELSDKLTAIKNRVQAIPGTTIGDKYDTQADFTKLDNLSATAANVAQKLDLSRYIEEAKDEIEKVKKSSTSNITAEINSASKTVNDIRDDVAKQTEKFKKSLDDATSFATSAMETFNVTANPEIQKYFDYVWYGGIALCCVYLLIIVCYYIGVLFGLCGERPGYDAPCCHKGIGANFLLAGVGFSFLFSWLLMLLVVIFFTVGGVSYTQVCQHFEGHNPSKLKVFAEPIVDSLNLSQTLYGKPGVHLDFVKMLEDCRDNKPVYEALKLENLFNLSSVIDLAAIEGTIKDIGKKDITVPKLVLLNPSLNSTLQDLATNNYANINFTEFEAETGKKLTTANLTDVARQLRTQAATSNEPALLPLADELEDLDRRVVRNMSRNVENLNKTLETLKKNMDIQPEANDLIGKLMESQTKFNTDSQQLINETVQKLVETLIAKTKTDVDQVIADVEKVGRCKPVFDSLYQATDAVCVTALNPFNALWFSWGWCLFFFIPSIVFALLLAGLYRREEKYTGEKDFDDHNFSMYGGPAQDTIPLTSMDIRHGGAGGRGMANSGYYEGHHGSRPKQSNGYSYDPPSYDMHRPGSKEMPPAYYGGGSPDYPSDYYPSRPNSHMRY